VVGGTEPATEGAMKIFWQLMRIDFDMQLMKDLAWYFFLACCFMGMIALVGLFV
jgi:hypothetical protein